MQNLRTTREVLAAIVEEQQRMHFDGSPSDELMDAARRVLSETEDSQDRVKLGDFFIPEHAPAIGAAFTHQGSGARFVCVAVTTREIGGAIMSTAEVVPVYGQRR